MIKGNPPSSLGSAAIERILVRVAAVGLGLPNYDPETDPSAAALTRLKLSGSISWAYTYREIHPDQYSDPRSRRRYASLDRIRRAAKTILEIVDDPKLPITSLDVYFPFLDEELPDFDQLKAGLARLATASEQERKRLRDAGRHVSAPYNRKIPGKPKPSAPPRIPSTPNSKFMEGLAKTYREFFQDDPDIKYNSAREATGAFIVFIEAITEEMEEPMTPEAIRKAWERTTSSDKHS